MQSYSNILSSKSTKMSTWIWPNGQMMRSPLECRTTRSIRCTATFPSHSVIDNTFIHTIHKFYHQYHPQARTFIHSRITHTHTCRQKIPFIKQLFSCCTLKKKNGREMGDHKNIFITRRGGAIGLYRHAGCIV